MYSYSAPIGRRRRRRRRRMMKSIVFSDNKTMDWHGGSVPIFLPGVFTTM